MKIKKQWKILLSPVVMPFLFSYILVRVALDLLIIASLFIYTAALNDEVEYKSFVFNKLLGR